MKYNNKFFKPKNNSKGQTLIEFVMLMVVMLTISTILYGSVKKGISIRWTSIIKAVSAPNVEEIKIP